MKAEPRFSRFGTAPESPHDDRDHEIRTYLAGRPQAATLPDEVGTINAEIHRRWLPITDQGQEGSCTGHAMRNTKGVNERRHRSTSARGRVPDFSPRGAYHLAKQEGGYPDEEGAYMRDVVKAANHIGVPREKDWPYVAMPPGPAGDPISRWLQYARPWKIGAYARTRTLEEMLTSLQQIGPLFIAMSLHESFFEPDSRGYIPAPSGQDVGGHAMCLLAAKQSERRFLVANSWGTSWGTGGYCWVDFDHFLTQVPSESWSIPDYVA